jgi:cobalt-zinc-cadmium efflux system membrane fusion protein
LIFVGKTVNADSRTVLVRTELDNKDGRIKPSVFLMLIESTPKKQLVVPLSAVVREQDTDYVF